MAISASLRWQIFSRDGFKCCYCGKQPPDVVLEIDHLVPVSRGGTNDSENLRTACMACNRGKSNNLPSSDLLNQKPIPVENLEEAAEQTAQFCRYLEKKQNEIQRLTTLVDQYWRMKTDNASLDPKYLSPFIVRFGLRAVIMAMDIAINQNILDGRYVFGILRNWRDYGLPSHLFSNDINIDMEKS